MSAPATAEPRARELEAKERTRTDACILMQQLHGTQPLVNRGQRVLETLLPSLRPHLSAAAAWRCASIRSARPRAAWCSHA
eukprot:33711-Eustigmatos_ZCMA.PRE.1